MINRILIITGRWIIIINNLKFKESRGLNRMSLNKMKKIEELSDE